MNDQQRKHISKFLSKYLRHEPESIGLVLSPGGWVEVDSLLEAFRKHGLAIDRAKLTEVVVTSDKKRFAFDDTGARIRANQGHSVEVDLQLEKATPPPVLFHGTATRFLPGILERGLQKMDRHHVHLSVDAATAVSVGARHGKPIVLTVDSAAMSAEGVLFFVSANGVWLTEEVPIRHLTVPEGTVE